MNSKELNLNMAWSGTDQGTQLKEGGSSGFNAVMTGVERKDLSIFNRFYSNFKEAYFWSSNKLDSNPGKAWKLALELSRAKVYYGITSKINGLSVRCIKNSEVMKVGGIKYNTIKIGTQIWTAENMRHGINSVENGIYSYYDDLNNDKLYGKSYAWSAAMRGATAEGSQGICAKNWRIPTDEDWKQLEGYLGMSQEAIDLDNTWRGTDQGAQLKKNKGTGFNAILQEGNNPSGLPNLLASTMWTSTSIDDDSIARSRALEDGKAKIYRGINIKQSAFSVRCIKQPVEKNINVALYKPTTQSSAPHNSHKAADNITDGNYFRSGGSSVTHTKAEKNPWWMVDLGKEYPISKIHIFNRTDCCEYRLDNYRVTIFNDLSINKSSYTNDFNSHPNPKKTIDLSAHPIKGRYVKIELLGDSSKRILSLAEVRVMAATSIIKAQDIRAKNALNVAEKKPTHQSSTLAASKRAVDGNTDGDYRHNSVSGTQPEAQTPWWYVDLKSKFYITKINIFNRTDCCRGRLKNYRITISDNSSFTQIKYMREFYKAPDPKITLDLSKTNITGRYVKIESLKLVGETAFLYLAEVQVMGVRAPSD
jgi:uncharacterized protein (TIGR02145 family)